MRDSSTGIGPRRTLEERFLQIDSQMKQILWSVLMNAEEALKLLNNSTYKYVILSSLSKDGGIVPFNLFP